jgi:hypothetical protein
VPVYLLSQPHQSTTDGVEDRIAGWLGIDRGLTESLTVYDELGFFGLESSFLG